MADRASNWRNGAPPAAPIPKEDGAALLADAEAAEAEAAETPQIILIDGRVFDLYWTHSPTDNMWVFISRRDKKMKKKGISRMPLILRNLASDSVFDPRKAWAMEKEARVEFRAAAEANETTAKAADAKTKGGKIEKEKKLTKADEIRVKNDEAQRAKEVGASRSAFAFLLADWVSSSSARAGVLGSRLEKVAGDMEKLDNAAKVMKKWSVVEVRAVKTVTSAGGLRKLLMVLEATLQAKDTPAIFDVLWAIEANQVSLWRPIRRAHPSRSNRTHVNHTATHTRRVPFLCCG
jgi:hypothetical protein